MVAVALAVPSSAEADHQWGKRYWADPTPIRVVDYGAARADNAGRWSRTLRAALAEWERSGVVIFRYRRERGWTPACRDYGPHAFARIRRQFPDRQVSVCRMQGGSPTAAAWTTVPGNGAIRKAVVALRSPKSACHEIGHSLGLDHPVWTVEDDPEVGVDGGGRDVRDSYLGIGDWRYPGVHDLEMLRLIYGA